MIEGEREEEEERWDCRDSLFDGRYAREEELAAGERARSTKALYCRIMIRLDGAEAEAEAAAAKDESAMKKLERSTCEWPFAAILAAAAASHSTGA